MASLNVALKTLILIAAMGVLPWWLALGPAALPPLYAVGASIVVVVVLLAGWRTHPGADKPAKPQAPKEAPAPRDRSLGQ